MKKLPIFLSLLALLLVLPPVPTHAESTPADNVHVTQDQIISGNLYVTGKAITIDGVISGDLIAAAKSITINGQVAGDIIAFAQEISIDGSVDGNVRTIARDVRINGRVARNISALGSTIFLGSSSYTAWDTYLAAAKIDALGKVEGNLNCWSNQVTVSGQVGKDLNISAPSTKKRSLIKIESTANIGSNVNYSSLEALDISETASVGGDINRSIPESQAAKLWGVVWLIKETILIFAALIMGLALIYLARPSVKRIVEHLEAAPLKAFLTGFWLFFAIPLASLVLAMTIIGLPFGLVIMALWLIAIYCGKIMLAILLGRLLVVNVLRFKQYSGMFWSLTIGVLVLWALTSLPVIGWLISLIAAWLGLGSIWNYANHKQ